MLEEKKEMILTKGAILILFLALSFSGCSKSKDLVLSGTIESTQININAEVPGRIIKLEKDEGAVVKTGEVIAAIDPSFQELNVKQQEAVVKLKQAKLDELQAGSRSEQIQQAEAAVKAAKAKLDELRAGTRPEQIHQAEAAFQSANTGVNTAEAGVETASINLAYWTDKYNTLRSLQQSSAASENDLKDAQYKVDSAKQQHTTALEQLKAAQWQLESSRSQLELLKNGSTTQSIQAAQANYEQALAQMELLRNGSTSQTINAAQADLEQAHAVLEQSKVTLSKYQVKASLGGTYLYRNVNIGDIVNSGTGIATISDLSDLWLKVYIPQKNLQVVSLDQEITLNSVSLPGKTLKGKVVYISSEAEYTPKNTETRDAKENTVFKLKIKLLDNIESLRPGMTCDAIIPLRK